MSILLLRFRDSLEDDYSVEDADYIFDVVDRLASEDNKNDVEFLMNVIDLFFELFIKEDKDEGVSDLEDKNKDIFEKYVSMGDIFETPLINDIKDENQKEIDLMKGAEVGTKGITKCKRCHLDNITFYSKQKAKADEGESVFITCLDCGLNWQE